MHIDKAMARLVKRLGEMNWEELHTRARHEVAKRSDLLLSSFGARFTKDYPSSVPEQCGHFFFKPADIPAILDLMRSLLPEVVDGIIRQAEQICQHRFDLLGYRNVNYGSQIDWHLDAVHGKRAPLHAWYKVPYLDFDKVGDSKITWELNRQQHLVTLAKAYRLTGRSEFALEIVKQWYDWQRQNPYPMGINWASSLEVAFRSLSWLWISHLLQDCSILPAGFLGDLRRALLLNGRHISRFPSTYFSPNTHLLGEGVGLFFIGTLCPGTAAQLWQREGWQVILCQAERQIRPDGMHFEHSTYYHTYALDFFLHARILASLNGIPIPAAFDRTIESMLEVTMRLSHGGSLPRLGDDDGGRVFDPRRNRSEHLLDPLAIGAVLFNRDDFKTAPGDVREETIWLLGVEAAGRFENLHMAGDAQFSFALEGSGIHVMASSEPAQQLVINAGPSIPGRQGHRHADTLSVQLSVNGNPMLIDPGTFAYVGEGGERDHFRGTSGHNSLQIDGLSQGEPAGPFQWQGLSRADVNRWVMGTTFDFFEGAHSDYRRLPDAVEHRRSILYIKPHFWLVRDVVSGTSIHQVDVHWHFAKGHLRATGNGATFVSNNHAALSLIFASNYPWSHELCTHWHSPVYGRKEPAPLVRSTTKGRPPVELVTLLIPISTDAARLGALEPLVTESKGSPVSAYRYAGTSAAEHLFVFSTCSGGWSFGPWSSDARLLFTTARRQGRPRAFVLCDASYLDWNGQRMLAAREVLSYAEFFFDGLRPQFRCSNPGAVRVNPTREAGTLSLADVLAAV